MCSDASGSLSTAHRKHCFQKILLVLRDAVTGSDGLANAVFSGTIISYTAWREVAHCYMAVYSALN
jgi:hypothetical protein